MSARWVEIDVNRFNPGAIANLGSDFAPGTVAVLPTDTSYVVACRMGDKASIDMVKKTLGLSASHLMTLMLSSFTALGRYAVVDNSHYRLLRSMVPGPYSFILPATKEVPRAFAHKKRRTIGLRVPDHTALRTFLEGVGEPVVTCSLHAPTAPDEAVVELADCAQWVRKFAGIVLDAGILAGSNTTHLDLSDTDVTVLREGRGDISMLGQ